MLVLQRCSTTVDPPAPLLPRLRWATTQGSRDFAQLPGVAERGATMPRSPSVANSTTVVEVSYAKVPCAARPHKSRANWREHSPTTAGTSDAHRPAAARPGGRRERVSAPALHQGQTLSPGHPALPSHETHSPRSMPRARSLLVQRTTGMAHALLESLYP